MRLRLHGAIRSSSRMQFCRKCGLTLVPTRKGEIVVLVCPKCGQETRLVALLVVEYRVFIIGLAVMLFAFYLSYFVR